MRLPPGMTHVGDLVGPVLEELKWRMEGMENGKETTGKAGAPGKPGKPRLPEVNEVRVVGRLVNPPKFKEGTNAGGAYTLARFMLATNRYRKNAAGDWEQEPSFIPVVAWREHA